MIEFDCPNCEEQLEIPGSKAGKSVTCPNCDKKIRVPLDDEDDEPVRERPVKRKRKRRASGNETGPSARNVTFGILFILLGSLMSIGGIIALAVGGRQPRDLLRAIASTVVGISLICGGIVYFRK